jgi:hypothetical protein
MHVDIDRSSQISTTAIGIKGLLAELGVPGSEVGCTELAFFVAVRRDSFNCCRWIVRVAFWQLFIEN